MSIRKPVTSVPASVTSATITPGTIRSDSLSVPQIVSEWMTTAEAAAYLKVKPRTLLKWVREGSVRAHPLHGTRRRIWRFRREDFDSALGLDKSVGPSVVKLPTSSVVRMREGGSL